MQGIFIGTFLIGLREGLEATLIVSVIGAFLTRNGKSTRPMVLGVAFAVVISVAVGAGLDVLSASLPQRQQEMLETVIGAIAVVFVTSMIIWMNRNSFRMKGQLEREAAQAVNGGSVTALALMAFLAVLKEGFETAVFLLAAAQTAQGSRWYALFGGVTGIATAVAVGAGIYFGSLRLDLGRFFRITGIFLVFIAAGLVMSGLRTAHEAGWVDVGQRRVVDLSAVLGTKSVVGAVVTGMFGIPPDPRLVEVLGWLLYAIPVLVVFQWPAALAPGPAVKRRVTWSVAAGLATVAAAMAVLIPAGGSPGPGSTRTATTAGGTSVTATVRADGADRMLTVAGAGGQRVSLSPAGRQSVDGVDVDVWQNAVPTDPGVTTSPVGLAQLRTLAGGRLPVGLGTARTPGPFDARWSARTVYTVVTRGDDVVSAERASSRVATLSGGGLAGPKTVSVGGLAEDWATSPGDDQAIAAAMTQSTRDHAERTLWTIWLPTVLAVAALLVGIVAARSARTTDEREPRQHGESPTRDQISVA
ncbi:high-affinity Fe2+/Pb2+ permease [Mycolicibacterium sp. P1-18]|uniref:iron uptake transporter permease EfeU n=1 Tax=Mycolicibacterium sp. P1-18 TaxID=2024615 RepID=UPI0011F3E117|nr:iron uptake transporter permease EfeU [Mycolicibacterium sp. P1-18]KAA0100092.1 high-affinity Fe2+/Pb2+ permease [Mycolicibacterium sp. P1-18]